MLMEDKRTPRVCEKCGKPMPKSVEDNVCPNCKNEALYNEAKDYILHNQVTELQVADRFQIPLAQVREWVRDGRIEYRPTNRW